MTSAIAPLPAYQTSIRQACRSLLQKAVRRGDEATVRIVIKHITNAGDTTWLKQRAAIIIFEECWYLACNFSSIPTIESALEALLKATKSTKQKNATGLGTLALAHSQGDASVLKDKIQSRHICVLSEGIKRPKDFWTWIKKSCTSNDQHILTELAYNTFQKGGWEWDLAFMQAAAYLAIIEEIPKQNEAKYQSCSVPIWVALDRHTQIGKRALQKVSLQKNLPYSQILWASFYFESAITNDLAESFWWNQEIKWRLNRVGLDINDAERLWLTIKPLFLELIYDEINNLESFLISDSSIQESLF